MRKSKENLGQIFGRLFLIVTVGFVGVMTVIPRESLGDVAKIMDKIRLMVGSVIGY